MNEEKELKEAIIWWKLKENIDWDYLWELEDKEGYNEFMRENET